MTSGTLLLLILAFGAVALGAIFLLARRRPRRSAAAILIILILGAVTVSVPATPAQAASAECVSDDNSLTVTQTSTLRGLAPGAVALPITGLVVNNGSEDTRIDAVSVAIVSVRVAADAVDGTCTPSDYTVFDGVMIVDRLLPPEGSVAFAGASLAFANKTTNQDACKGATITLRYTANPA